VGGGLMVGGGGMQGLFGRGFLRLLGSYKIMVTQTAI
jgi:hypothetical protein